MIKVLICTVNGSLNFRYEMCKQTQYGGLRWTSSCESGWPIETAAVENPYMKRQTQDPTPSLVQTDLTKIPSM